jgi:hypothetical protein
MLSSALARDRTFATRLSNQPYMRVSTSNFLGDQENFACCKSSSHHSSGWVLTSSAEVSFQEASAGYQTLALHLRQNEYQPQSPDMLKDAECKKGQLSQRLPIPYVPVVDIVMPKEEPQVLKVKLPDASHISVPI